ncbi:unnamed protein product [Adineta steineri]|uniref:Uncharacterized protein n=1 Tax=Adineta steineri TaxID=433720 RepID=A0A820HK90_9BILA|nr:unnamed protein product [Adineta steineri]
MAVGGVASPTTVITRATGSTATVAFGVVVSTSTSVVGTSSGTVEKSPPQQPLLSFGFDLVAENAPSDFGVLDGCFEATKSKPKESSGCCGGDSKT